ncbi:hypothetical protein F5X68DRAFT_207054 [Plectosphaerella plurivora]|uniref:Secreted protein n=1 Tax=Plectosphaerella plurivora TaxID=936078 RepID=A0A9P8VBC8_9PEZI|nr:hypothetical protein F5X68DRAFT_207054 [Plectosphaerella plurivora]
MRREPFVLFCPGILAEACATTCSVQQTESQSGCGDAWWRCIRESKTPASAVSVSVLHRRQYALQLDQRIVQPNKNESQREIARCKGGKKKKEVDHGHPGQF